MGITALGVDRDTMGRKNTPLSNSVDQINGGGGGGGVGLGGGGGGGVLGGGGGGGGGRCASALDRTRRGQEKHFEVLRMLGDGRSAYEDVCSECGSHTGK